MFLSTPRRQNTEGCSYLTSKSLAADTEQISSRKSANYCIYIYIKELKPDLKVQKDAYKLSYSISDGMTPYIKSSVFDVNKCQWISIFLNKDFFPCVKNQCQMMADGARPKYRTPSKCLAKSIF